MDSSSNKILGKVLFRLLLTGIIITPVAMMRAAPTNLPANQTSDWGAPIAGFQVRLHKPSTAESTDAPPRLLVDVANQGLWRYSSMTNYYPWQLEVDGRWYVADGKRTPIKGGAYVEVGGVELEVVPGQPWTNLPLVLDATWRIAHSNELGTAKFGGGGYGIPSDFPHVPLKLAAGNHTVRLAVIGIPMFARGGGPVRAISKPVAMIMAESIAQSAILNSQSSGSVVVSTLTQVPPSERRVSITALQKTLKDVLAEICRQAGVELELDVDGLKLSGVSVDAPVTLKCQDETLQWAVGRILRSLDRQGNTDIVQDTSSGKLILTSIKALNDRRTKAQPAWLIGYGYVSKFDDQTNIVSVYVGEKADDELLAKLKTMPKLRELDIEGTKLITPAGLAHLAELPTLEKLSLYDMSHDGADLGNDATPILSQMKSLRELRISYCSLTDVGLHALEGMTQLTALNLSHNRLSDVGMKSLAGLTNLQSFDVSDLLTSGMRITDEGIKQLPQLKELRELSLVGLKISGKNLAFPHLQSLDLSGDLVTDAALDNIVQCQEMRHLGLSWTRISDEGLKRVASLKELRSLSLTSKLITDDGIAHLTDLPNLEHIEMHVTQMSDESLKHLSQIKSLRRLDLFGSEEGFTIHGLQQLKNLPQLRELWINNFKSSDSFMGLSELKQLSSLTLFFTNIRDEEAEQLEAAMPDTRISAGSSRITGTVKK